MNTVDDDPESTVVELEPPSQAWAYDYTMSTSLPITAAPHISGMTADPSDTAFTCRQQANI